MKRRPKGGRATLNSGFAEFYDAMKGGGVSRWLKGALCSRASLGVGVASSKPSLLVVKLLLYGVLSIAIAIPIY
jgi:hypothetical protein